MAPHAFLPSHRRQLRRRYNPGSNIGSVKQRNRNRCSGMRVTCMIAGVVFLTTLIFVSNFSNVRQNQLGYIELNDISSTINTTNPPPTTTTASNRTFQGTESPADETYMEKTEPPKPPSLSLSNLPPCDDDCQIHRRQRLDQSGGVNLLDVSDLISSVQAKKQALLDLLGASDQYGDLAGRLFEPFDTPSGKHVLSSQLFEADDATANPSRDRLRDKVQRKVLQVQLEIIQQDNRPTAAAMDAAYRAAHTGKTAATDSAGYGSSDAAPAESVGYGSSDVAPAESAGYESSDAAPAESAGYESPDATSNESMGYDSAPVHNEQRLRRQLSEMEQQAKTDPYSMDVLDEATDEHTNYTDPYSMDVLDEATEADPETDPSGMDDDDEATGPSPRTLSPPSVQVPYKFKQIRLVWATAGDGASAGHGNLAEESYTAILEQAAGPVFGAAGIELTTRNYGWSGAIDKSAPELALCLDSVYGTDVDILAWDFEESASQSSQRSQQERQQREREHGWKRHMFWARAALQENRPAVVAMNLNDVPNYVQGGSSDSHPILQELDQLGANGMTALGWNPDVIRHVHKNIIPDATDLLPGEENTTPANVRLFKCGGQMESGLLCEDEKFSDHAGKSCRNRLYRDASHPGWKQHALTGNLMALFLVDLLLEALQDLELSTEDLAARLARLEAVEVADNERFRSEAPLPMLPTNVFNPSDFSVTSNLFQKRSLCHTARLPSEMRYKGILTGRTAQEFDHFYREGMEREKADNLMSTMFDEGADVANIESDEMKLVYSKTLRQRRCNTTLNIDYPDSFYTGPNEGWKSLKILTPIEKETYKIDSPKGLIMVCLVQPNFYSKGFNGREIQVGDLKQHPLVTFRVNGQDVEALSWIDSCFILNGPQGHYWVIGSDGQYEIEARVGNTDNDDHDILQISSVILL